MSNSQHRRRRTVWAGLCTGSWFAVAAFAGPPAAPPPPSPTGWTVSTPAAEGLDVERVGAAVGALRAHAGTRRLLVVRNGRLVVEENFRGPVRGKPENLKSASKSLLSALVGIALADGVLAGLDQPVAELLPEQFAGIADPGRRAITLRHLLTMTTGLASTSREAYGAWVASRDWLAAALARPRLAPPGETFLYSTGNSHLISAILTRATGESTLDYARRKLLQPLGIAVGAWQRDPQGIYFGGNQLTMTPRDLARFGQLYLQEGLWNGRRIVPAAWIDESTRGHAEGWPERYGAYGYLWWVRPAEEGGAYLAAGYGGQFLYVAPQAAMSIVLTSTLDGKGETWDREVLAAFGELAASGAGTGDGSPP